MAPDEVAVPAHPGPPPPGTEVHAVTVLYDAGCSLCRGARAWLERQPQRVPLRFVAAGSPEARERFFFLDPRQTLQELTVVADGGEVYVGAKAWVVCLWALRGRTGLARHLSSPAALPAARHLVTFVSRHRRSSGTYGDRCDRAG